MGSSFEYARICPSLVQGIFAYYIFYNSSTIASWSITIYFPQLFSSYVVIANIIREVLVFHFKVYALQ